MQRIGQMQQDMMMRRRGVSGMVYALLLGLVAVVAITAITTVGGANRTLFQTVSNRLGNVTGDGAGSAAPVAPPTSAACSSQTVSGYSVPALAHGASQGVSKTVAISNGSQAYNAMAGCTNGTVAISGEVAGTITCNSGFGLVSGACVTSSFVSCRAIYNSNGTAPNGLYAIDPDGAGSGTAIQAYCDMVSGGYTLVLMDSGTACDVPLASASSYGWQGDPLTTTQNSNCGILGLSYAQSKGLVLLNHYVIKSNITSDRSSSGLTFMDAYNRMYFEAFGGIEYGNPGFASGTRINSWISPNGIGSGIGCPMLNNQSAAESTSFGQNMSQGTAGTGDTNNHNGGGCWGVASTGPVSGSIWVR